MLLLLTLVLFGVLLDRVGLGFYTPLRRQRQALQFEEHVLQLGEEVQWREKTVRQLRALPPACRTPHLSLR